MNRRDLLLGSIFLSLQITGCGSPTPPPADGSNLPAEVKEEEDRMNAAREKRIADAKKAKP